jgi:hypothetical protein
MMCHHSSASSIFQLKNKNCARGAYGHALHTVHFLAALYGILYLNNGPKYTEVTKFYKYFSAKKKIKFTEKYTGRKLQNG